MLTGKSLTRRGLLVSALALALAACGRRGEVTMAPTAAGVGSAETLYVASARLPLAGGVDYSGIPAPALSFSRVAVSVPPDRAPGTVSIGRPGQADPRRDFVTLSSMPYADGRAFLAALNRAAAALPPAQREVTVFVHGFNTTFAEGLYRHAQMRHDFEMPGLSVTFSWPSAATVSAYATDREAALTARDRLEDLLVLLARSNLSRIVVIGHSMGALVVMEAMRQIAIRGEREVLRKARAVVLIAPDLDIGMFRGQMAALAGDDVSLYIFTSSRDRALRLSALLRGQPERLGGLTDLAPVADLPVTIIDLSAVGTQNDSLNHFKVATSPAMISLIRGMDSIGQQVFRDEMRDPNIFEASIGLVQEATSVVLIPVSGR